jgi:hypothetical protein
MKFPDVAASGMSVLYCGILAVGLKTFAMPFAECFDSDVITPCLEVFGLWDISLIQSCSRRT